MSQLVLRLFSRVSVVECGGKRSATPLFASRTVLFGLCALLPASESGVADARGAPCIFATALHDAVAQCEGSLTSQSLRLSRRFASPRMNFASVNGV
jgi:hypothetical protein